MVQALPQNYQVQQAPSPQVAPQTVAPQWQSAPQLVNPYPSTGLTPQYSHPQQFAPTPQGWVQTTPQSVVAPTQQANPVTDYLTLNGLVPNSYLPNPTSVQPQSFPQAISSPTRQYSPKIDLNAPSGRDSQGNPLASVIELINAFGDGSPELAIARIHQQLITREDQLGEVVAYTQALEKEAITMGNILKDPESTGYWLQYQEFHLNQLPNVQAFRAQYPQATFEQFYEWLRQTSQVQQTPQGYPQPQQPTFNELNMGLGTSANPTNGRLNPLDILRKMDTGHFGQFVSQLA